MELNFGDAVKSIGKLKANIESVVFGQKDLITETLCCLVAGGHILMTGAPGLAKTTLVRVIANYLGLNFARVQFTPDLLPSDIIGSEVLNVDPESGRRHFEFSRGPIFTNLLLADEINRASPRTQSALLEAMQERACTVAGKRYPFDLPFMVFATQNPFESEGTFPLPEAQLDRFLLHTLVDYPDEGAEAQILKEHTAGNLAGESELKEATSGDQISREQLAQISACSSKIRIADELLSAVNDLVRSTRPNDANCPEKIKPCLYFGAGPRAGISLISTARALALIEGSEDVRWAHIKRLAKPILRHRIKITAAARRDQIDEDGIVDTVVSELESRHANLAKGV